MKPEDNKKVVRTFYTAINNGDLDAALEVLSDDVRWTNIGSTQFSGTCNGKVELVEKLLGPLFGMLEAGITATLQNLIAEEAFVAAQIDGTARTRDGCDYNNTYCHVFEFRDAKIVAVTEYFDTELASRVLGGPV